MKTLERVIVCVIYIICIWGIKSGVCQLDPDTQKAIDDLIQSEIITKSKIPAMSLGIVRNGEVAYTTAYGMRDVENSVRADKSTLFFIGSISKSFTATICVKVLSEKFPELGETVLDTPIRKLSPSYNFTLTDRYRSESTSMRDILAHRVGENVQSLNLAYGAFSDSKELVYRLRYAKEQYPFRTEFLYNNGHFALAADVIAEIAGVPFLQLLEEFLGQLEMSNTTYVKPSDDHDNMPNRAVGYYYNETILRFNSEYYKTVVPAIGAGGILSNAEDMVKYAQFHLNSGRVGNTQLIPQEVMKWMHRNNNPMQVTGWKTQPDQQVFFNIGYGLGFILSDLDGWQVIQHSGYLPPFSSLITLFPALNVSIFTSSSSNGALLEWYVPQEDIHKAILNILQGGTKRGVSNSAGLIKAASEALRWKNLKKKKHTVSICEYCDGPLQAGEILGHYGNGLNGEMDITEKLNTSGVMQPYLNYGDWGYGWLQQISNNEFSFKCESDYVQTLYNAGFNESFAQPSLTYDRNLETMIFDHYGEINEFQKNQELVNLPERPWNPDSCGPELLKRKSS